MKVYNVLGRIWSQISVFFLNFKEVLSDDNSEDEASPCQAVNKCQPSLFFAGNTLITALTTTIQFRPLLLRKIKLFIQNFANFSIQNSLKKRPIVLTDRRCPVVKQRPGETMKTPVIVECAVLTLTGGGASSHQNKRPSYIVDKLVRINKHQKWKKMYFRKKVELVL